MNFPHLVAFCKKQTSDSNITILGCTEFNGQQIRSTVVLNPVERSAVILEDKDDSELKGPVVRQHTMEDFVMDLEMILLTVTSCRLTGAACVVTKRGWFTTPDRWDQQMKDKPSSTLVFTAGDQWHHMGCFISCCDSCLNFDFLQVSGEGGLLRVRPWPLTYRHLSPWPLSPPGIPPVASSVFCTVLANQVDWKNSCSWLLDKCFKREHCVLK